MCLIALAYGMRPDMPLAVAANRDEFHARPTLSADYWPDHPQVLAGRDLEAGGTWMGVSKTGRFAAITNYATLRQAGAKSRGELVADFLTGFGGALDYARAIRGDQYAGFNLMLFDGSALVHLANDESGPRALEAGVHGISNTALGAAWPKMKASTALLRESILTEKDTEYLIAGMRDTTPAGDDQIPAGDAPIELRRRTSSCFVLGGDYGTRATTLVFLRARRLAFIEQCYGPDGRVGRRQDFSIELPPNWECDAASFAQDRERRSARS